MQGQSYKHQASNLQTVAGPSNLLKSIGNDTQMKHNGSPVANKKKHTSIGFNYTRAVQGSSKNAPKPQASPQKLSTSKEPITPNKSQNPSTLKKDQTAPAPTPIYNSFAALDSILDNTFGHTNKTISTPPSQPTFSVLNIPESIKKNTLIDEPPDLYPASPSVQGPTPNSSVNNLSNPTPTSCSMNKSYYDNTRILPNWNAYKLNSRVEDLEMVSDEDDDDNGYDYGLTDEQKNSILNYIQKKKLVPAHIAFEWCPDEREFFEDNCKAIGLDPDECYEIIGEDTSGMGSFLNRQLNKGTPYDPVIAKPNKGKP